MALRGYKLILIGMGVIWCANDSAMELMEQGVDNPASIESDDVQPFGQLPNCQPLKYGDWEDRIRALSCHPDDAYVMNRHGYPIPLLQTAAVLGDCRMISFLLQYGASPYLATDFNGRQITAYILARHFKRAGACLLLEQHDRNQNLAMHHFVSAAVGHGAGRSLFEYERKTFLTPLGVAVVLDDFHSIRTLYLRGAPMNDRMLFQNEFITAREIAERLGRWNAVKELESCEKDEKFIESFLV